MNLIVLALAVAAVDGGTHPRFYRVIRETCQPCRLEDFMAEAKGTKNCGTFRANEPTPAILRCIYRAMEQGQPFHARNSFRDHLGNQVKQAFGLGTDGGFWFDWSEASDNRGAPCSGLVRGHSCAGLNVSGPNEPTYVECEKPEQRLLCAEDREVRLSLGPLRSASELRCSFRQDGQYADCNTDDRALFRPEADGADLICLPRKTGLACGPEIPMTRAGDGWNAFIESALIPPQCRGVDAGPPFCLGPPHDEALERIRALRVGGLLEDLPWRGFQTREH